VLVQTNANRFWVDLDQFGQRILRAPGNADGTADRDIQFGKFGASQG